MYDEEFAPVNPPSQADNEQLEVTLNKLVGLMECGIEPTFHDGIWTVAVVDHLHEQPFEGHVDNVVIAQLKRYEFGEVAQKGNETIFRLKDVA